MLLGARMGMPLSPFLLEHQLIASNAEVNYM
jgi:hypothetical protein